MKKTHESYGMVSFSKYSGRGCEFFGSDIKHNGGVTLRISRAEVDRHLSNNWYHDTERLIEIDLSYNQFVDAITAGMNTQGVPCTLKYYNREKIPQIAHVTDNKQVFKQEMSETQKEYLNKIDAISDLLEGTIGKRKVEDIKHALHTLKMHINGNTNFVMKQFDEAMDRTVNEAKHSIANYIDNKIHSVGLEALRNELQIGMGNEE